MWFSPALQEQEVDKHWVLLYPWVSAGKHEIMHKDEITMTSPSKCSRTLSQLPMGVSNIFDVELNEEINLIGRELPNSTFSCSHWTLKDGIWCCSKETSCETTPSNSAFMLKKWKKWHESDSMCCITTLVLEGLSTYYLFLTEMPLAQHHNTNLHMQDDWKGRIVFILVEVKS